MPAPTATLSDLHRADGSATYTANGYTVIGAVNGPVEVQRRDELPDEAAIEVNVRPAAGVGTTRERHLESIIQSTLKSILLVHEFPRSLIQLTLQVISVPESQDGSRHHSYLPLLPPLLTTSLLTLLSASLPLSTTLASTLVALDIDQKVIPSPNAKDIAVASSLHVFSFSGSGDLLVSESEGDFDIDSWEEAYEVAEGVCIGDKEDMDVEGAQDQVKQSAWLRKVVGEKVQRDQQWRNMASGRVKI